MEGSKKKASKLLSKKGRPKKGATEAAAEVSEEIVAQEAPNAAAEADAAPVVSEEASTAAEAEPEIRKDAPEDGVPGEAAVNARESKVVEVVEADEDSAKPAAEPQPEPKAAPAKAEIKESKEESAMNEETKVEVAAEAPAPEPAPAPAKKTVIANPDRQLVDMVKSRSFSGPKDKLPTYLL